MAAARGGDAARLRGVAEAVFRAGVAAVSPAALIRHHIELEDAAGGGAGQTLVVRPRRSSTEGQRRVAVDGNVLVAAFGKAVLGMVQVLDEVLGDHIRAGIASVPVGSSASLGRPTESGEHASPLRIEIREGARDNVPDTAACQTATDILAMASAAGEDDVLVVLMSGGGSALLPLPVPGVTLAEKAETVRLLGKAGATIQELNTIRKHLSLTKGGKLAAAAAPATVIGLVLSDVIGDDLQVIASGPTVADDSTLRDCQAILRRLSLVGQLPESVRHHLMSGSPDVAPAAGTGVHSSVYNVLIGSNAIALQAAAAYAASLGFACQLRGSAVAGNAHDVAREFCRGLGGIEGRVCVLAGGETTVTVAGHGKGGRNQELAVVCAKELAGTDGVVVLSAGTDGQDGPTDAAGAFADGLSAARFAELGLDPDAFLKDSNSHELLSRSGNLLRTGLTGTNVMDLIVAVVDR